MKKNNFIFLFTILLCFFGCVDDSENTISSKHAPIEYKSKSPWKEDEAFIKKVRTVFLKNVDSNYFEDKYGVVSWDYGMSFGHFDESYFIVPIVKDFKVSTVMKVVRKGSKVFFMRTKIINLIIFLIKF